MAKVTKLTSTQIFDIINNVASANVREIINEKTCTITIARLEESVAADVQEIEFKKDGTGVRKVVKNALCFSMNDNQISCEQYKGAPMLMTMPNYQEMYTAQLNEMVDMSVDSVKGESIAEFEEYNYENNI